MTRQEELRALRDAATKGPWKLTIETSLSFTTAEITQNIDEYAPYRGLIARCQSAEHISGIDADELRANAALIAQAPTLATELADVLDRAEAAGAALILDEMTTEVERLRTPQGAADVLLAALPPDFGHDGLRWGLAQEAERSLRYAHPQTDRTAAIYHAIRAALAAAVRQTSA